MYPSFLLSAPDSHFETLPCSSTGASPQPSSRVGQGTAMPSREETTRELRQKRGSARLAPSPRGGVSCTRTKKGKPPRVAARRGLRRWGKFTSKHQFYSIFRCGMRCVKGSAYMNENSQEYSIDDDYETLCSMRNDENMQAAVRVGVVAGIALPVIASGNNDFNIVIKTLQLVATLQMVSNPEIFTTALEMVKGSDANADDDYWKAIGSILDGVDTNG